MDNQQPAVPKSAVNLMFLLTAAFWFSQYAITPYINAELSRMGATASMMGLVGGAYGLTQLLVRIPLGMAADWYGRQKPFIILGCALSALGMVGFLLWYTPLSFVVWRGVAGLASASWVSFTILFGSYFSHEEGPRRISQLNTFNQLGRLFCYVIIGAAVARFALGAAFWIATVAGGATLIISLYVVEGPKHQRKPLKLRDFAAVARNRHLMYCSVLGILTQVIAFSTYYGFNVNLAKGLGATSAQLSLLSISLVVPAVLFNYLGSGLLMNRYRPRVLIAIGYLMAALYCVLAPLCTSLLQLYAIHILAGIASAFTFGLLLGQSVKTVPYQLRSAGMGFFQSVYGIGMTLGPVLMGLLIDWSNYRTAFFTVAALSLFTAWLAYHTLERADRVS